MKEHECVDLCRLDEANELWRIPPRYMRWWLPVGRLRHVCGPWCSPKDPDTPVRLGRAGEPVSYDLGLSPQAAELLARLRSGR